MQQVPFTIGRENHLNHMVKVVPLIVMGYALQCYFILHLGHSGFAADSLLFLGLALGGMIAGFITYDLKHKVTFTQTELEISFLGFSNKMSYSQIADIRISKEGEIFATMTITNKQGIKYKIYFMDDADKIKKWLYEQSQPIKYQKVA